MKAYDRQASRYKSVHSEALDETDSLMAEAKGVVADTSAELMRTKALLRKAETARASINTFLHETKEGSDSAKTRKVSSHHNKTARGKLSTPPETQGLIGPGTALIID